MGVIRPGPGQSQFHCLPLEAAPSITSVPYYTARFLMIMIINTTNKTLLNYLCLVPNLFFFSSSSEEDYHEDITIDDNINLQNSWQIICRRTIHNRTLTDTVDNNKMFVYFLFCFSLSTSTNYVSIFCSLSWRESRSY